MKKTTLRIATLVAATASMALAALPAHARKDTGTFTFAAVMAHPDYAAKIGDFKFGFGDAVRGQSLGQSSTRKATNGFGKSDEQACVWAALSALIAMKNDAIARGGTSVQGIKSMVTGTAFSSATEFQCISGTTNSRVYFEGVVVK